MGFGLNQTGIIRTEIKNPKNIEPKTEPSMVGSVSVKPVWLGFLVRFRFRFVLLGPIQMHTL